VSKLLAGVVDGSPQPAGCAVTATWTIRRRSWARMTRNEEQPEYHRRYTKRSAAMIWLA
jgi:hypothetical protein